MSKHDSLLYTNDLFTDLWKWISSLFMSANLWSFECTWIKGMLFAEEMFAVGEIYKNIKTER